VADSSTTDPSTENEPVPVIVYLSGRHRGTTAHLTAQTIYLEINADGGLAITPAVDAHPDADNPARLHRSGDSYELDVQPDHNVWVNGESTQQHTLVSGDLMEIGRNGPMLRFRLYPAKTAPRRTAADAFSDCVDCARYSDGSLVRRGGRFIASAASELLLRTTFWFRTIVIVVLVGLLASTLLLSQRSRDLEQRIQQETLRMQSISELLEQTGRDAISERDLVALRGELEQNLSTTVQRVEALEARSDATRSVIARASQSVVFLQGGYGYDEQQTGRPLRYLGIGPDGRPLRTAAGPAVTLDGDGPVVEMQYTGTGFLATESGRLLTNRHVAMPWENNPAHEQFTEMNLTPVIHRFIGYLPGVETAFGVHLIAASDDADLAILQCDTAVQAIPHLVPSAHPAEPGDEVIVLGYPTGIRAMLARTDTKFIDTLRDEEDLDFWTIVERLANTGRISPIATRGIVGQTTAEAVVYDAETTRGGSGGPVLNMIGEVIAINAAILPEFGGSNLGVPIARSVPLLTQLPPD